MACRGAVEGDREWPGHSPTTRLLADPFHLPQPGCIGFFACALVGKDESRGESAAANEPSSNGFRQSPIRERVVGEPLSDETVCHCPASRDRRRHPTGAFRGGWAGELGGPLPDSATVQPPIGSAQGRWRSSESRQVASCSNPYPLSIAGFRLSIGVAVWLGYEEWVGDSFESMCSGMSTAITRPRAQISPAARTSMSVTTLRGFTSTMRPHASSGTPIGVGRR